MEAYVLYRRFGVVPWQTEVEYDREERVRGNVFFFKGGGADAKQVFAVPENRLIDVRAKKNLTGRS